MECKNIKLRSKPTNQPTNLTLHTSYSYPIRVLTSGKKLPFLTVIYDFSSCFETYISTYYFRTCKFKLGHPEKTLLQPSRGVSTLEIYTKFINSCSLSPRVKSAFFDNHTFNRYYFEIKVCILRFCPAFKSKFISIYLPVHANRLLSSGTSTRLEKNDRIKSARRQQNMK